MRRLRRSFVGQESMGKKIPERGWPAPVAQGQAKRLLHDGKGPARRQGIDRDTSRQPRIEADYAIFG
jgi:hypothetical protein